MKLGLREANQHFSKAIKAVRGGKEVILTERGRPIAIIKSVLCDNSIRALRGLKVVELEQTTETFTTRDRACADRGCPRCDELVAQTLVRTLFMIVKHERSYGRPKVRFAEQHHPLQALGFGGLDESFRKGVQIRTPGGRTTGFAPLSRSRRRNAVV